jgi:hypothetical protein
MKNGAFKATLHFKHGRLIRSSWAAFCLQQSIMLPAETLEKRKHLLTLSLAKLRQKAKAPLTIYELFIYGDIHFVKLRSKHETA